MNPAQGDEAADQGFKRTMPASHGASPLNPVFGGRQMSERSTETEKEAAC